MKIIKNRLIWVLAWIIVLLTDGMVLGVQLYTHNYKMYLIIIGLTIMTLTNLLTTVIDYKKEK
jgi:hypothetical protein